MNPVEKCFEILFPKGSQEKNLWEKSIRVMGNFDIKTVGKELALKCLCYMVNGVNFPKDIKTESILKAEGFFPEILGVAPEHEFHMAEIEIIENLLNEGKTVKEISEMYKNKSRSE